MLLMKTGYLKILFIKVKYLIIYCIKVKYLKIMLLMNTDYGDATK
jgi:hypothetical protein